MQKKAIFQLLVKKLILARSGDVTLSPEPCIWVPIISMGSPREHNLTWVAMAYLIRLKIL